MSTLNLTSTIRFGNYSSSSVGNSIRSTSQLLMGLTFGVLIAVSLAGNTLVCVAVYTNKKLRKKENLYFVSLAGADLLLSILVMPFGAVNEIASQWLFGNYCKYWMCLDILFVTASILHLAAISFDRYSHIHDPMSYEERMSVSKIGAAIFGVWAVSIAVAFLPLAFDTYFHRALVAEYDLKNNETQSAVNAIRYQCQFNLDPLYAILSSLASFYIPCVLMILAYGKLYRYARRHSRAIRKQQEEVRMPLLVKPSENDTSTRETSTTTTRNGVITHKKQKSQQRQGNNKNANKTTRMDGDQKARVTLGVITGVFLASWLPFFVANIARSWCDDDSDSESISNFSSMPCMPHWLFSTLTWMGYANSAQNPIIYSIFNRDFRQAFRKILLCGRRRAQSNSTIGDQTTLTVQTNKGSSPNRNRRKSEAPTLIRKESPCTVFDARTRNRSASIVARLATADHFINDSNGCYFQGFADTEAKNALDPIMSYTKLPQVSNNNGTVKGDNSSRENSFCTSTDETIWIPREDADRKKSFADYAYCWHTSLALACCFVSAIVFT